MTFDPNQPRDDDGRWTHLAGRMKSHGGFTSMATGEEATSGFSVGIGSSDGKDWERLPHGATTAAHLRGFAAKHAAELAKPNRGIGGWSNSNPDWGDVRDALDIVEVHHTLEDALKAARLAGQDAIFDLTKGEEIPVPKTKRKDLSVTTSIITPSLAGQYDLSVKDGRLAFWKQVLPEKLIHYTDKAGKRQTLNFTEQYLTDLANNKAKDKVDFMLAGQDNSHTMDPERWRGEVAEWQIKDGQANPDHNGLYARIVFPNQDAARAVLANPDLGVSARIREDIQRSDGSTVPRGIVHVLGTLDPQVSGMSGWTAADLSTESDNLLDLTAETYENGSTMTDETKGVLTKPVVEYTNEEIDAFDDETLDAFLEAVGVDVNAILDEDEDELVEEDEIKESEMALSKQAQHDIDLARSDARAARTELAQARWDRTKDAYLNAGVPVDLIDLAEPIFNRPAEFIVDLSSDGGEGTVNVNEIVSKLLDAQKGTIDLSAEAGHGGTFKSGDGEDPDKPLLDLWDAQS